MGSCHSTPPPPPQIYEAPSVVTNVRSSSSGFHLVELHSPTAGAGMLGALIVVAIVYCCFRCFRRMERALPRHVRPEARLGPSPVPQHLPVPLHVTWQPPLPSPRPDPGAPSAPSDGPFPKFSDVP